MPGGMRSPAGREMTAATGPNNWPRGCGRQGTIGARSKRWGNLIAAQPGPARLRTIGTSNSRGPSVAANDWAAFAQLIGLGDPLGSNAQRSGQPDHVDLGLSQIHAQKPALRGCRQIRAGGAALENLILGVVADDERDVQPISGRVQSPWIPYIAAPSPSRASTGRSGQASFTPNGTAQSPAQRPAAMAEIPASCSRSAPALEHRACRRDRLFDHGHVVRQHAARLAISAARQGPTRLAGAGHLVCAVAGMLAVRA